MAETLADRLQLVIRVRGYRSPYEWSQKAGVSDSTIQNIITRGSGARPSTLAKLADSADVPFEWLATGKGASGLDDAPAEGPRVEREPQPAYSDSEAPFNFNLPSWRHLCQAALNTGEGREMDPVFVELVGYNNGLATGPLTPGGLVTLAKAMQEIVTPADAEQRLIALRAQYRQPALVREAKPSAKRGKG